MYRRMARCNRSARVSSRLTANCPNFCCSYIRLGGLPSEVLNVFSTLRSGLVLRAHTEVIRRLAMLVLSSYFLKFDEALHGFKF